MPFFETMLLSRIEFLRIITRITPIEITAAGIEAETVNETAFPDFENISAYAQNAVYTLYEMGVIDGDDEGYFNPKNHITRAEVSKILSLVM